MAIDYGSKRLGIAVSDTTATLAQPITVVERTKNKHDLAILAKLVEEYGIEKVVVGYPATLAGRTGPQAELVEKFIAELRQVLVLPIEKYDERLSSKEARTWLAQLGLRGPKARNRVDKVAAALVLQSYLDRQVRGASS